MTLSPTHLHVLSTDALLQAVKFGLCCQVGAAPRHLIKKHTKNALVAFFQCQHGATSTRCRCEYGSAAQPTDRFLSHTSPARHNTTNNSYPQFSTCCRRCCLCLHQYQPGNGEACRGLQRSEKAETPRPRATLRWALQQTTTIARRSHQATMQEQTFRP